MKTQIAEENCDAASLLPPDHPDGSGIGVHFVDAYIKPLNVELDDGRTITCKRKGLKIILSIGDRTGEALLRRLDDGPDPREMLQKSLMLAANEAGSQFAVEDGKVLLDV